MLFFDRVEIPRVRKRMMELMIKTACERPTSENEKLLSSARSEWHLTFLRSPVRFNACKSNPDRLESVQFAINRLEVISLSHIPFANLLLQLYYSYLFVLSLELKIMSGVLM